MNQYPAVAFIVKHAKPLTFGIALSPALLIALLVFATNAHWLWLVLALGVLPLSYLIASSYVELIAIIADMLLPKY